MAKRECRCIHTRKADAASAFYICPDLGGVDRTFAIYLAARRPHFKHASTLYLRFVAPFGPPARGRGYSEMDGQNITYARNSRTPQCPTRKCGTTARSPDIRSDQLHVFGAGPSGPYFAIFPFCAAACACRSALNVPLAFQIQRSTCRLRESAVAGRRPAAR